MKAKAPYFKPIVGELYKNTNGTKYLCVKSNDERAEFISITSGWYLRALGCHQEPNGEIWWDTSTGVGFKFFRYSYVSESTDKTFMSNLGYYYHICGVELHGEIIKNDVYCIDDQSFCVELTKIFEKYLHTAGEDSKEFDIPTIMLLKLTD